MDELVVVEESFPGTDVQKTPAFVAGVLGFFFVNNPKVPVAT